MDSTHSYEKSWLIWSGAGWAGMLFPQVFYVSIEYTTKNTVSAPRLPGYSKMSSIPYNFPGPVSSFI